MFEHLTLKALDFYKALDSTVTSLLMIIVLSLVFTVAILIIL